MGTGIGLEIDDPVAVVTLRRPDKLNAFTNPMLRELEAAVVEAVADTRVVGVVITGEGRGFCAGLDASALTDAAVTGSSGRPERTERLPGLFSYLLEQPKPIIAAVNGVTAGGGFVLAAKCDLRFASTDASFVSVFSRRGLIAEHGLTWLVPRQIGTGAALDLLWSSRRVDADEALRIGLVQVVTEPDRLVDAAADYVRELASTVAPTSLAETKRLVYAGFGTAMEAAFDEADVATYEALDGPDPAEGVASFVERRPPEFRRLGEGT